MPVPRNTLHRSLPLSALLLVACGSQVPPPAPGTPAAAAASREAAIELASIPAPAFLENLLVTPAGEILFTNYLGRTIERIDADGKRTTFAALDAHPVSLVAQDGGYLVAVHGTSFTEGPAFLGTGRLLFVDASGAVTRSVALPDAGFINGMDTLPGGTLLIADSAQARILAFDPAGEAVVTWFADPVLAPQADPFLPGANGIARVGDSIVVSSSARRSLFRVAIAPDGSASGPLQTLASGLPGADDFEALPDGGFVVATHGHSVVRVGASQQVTTVTEDPRVRGNTAVAVLGTGATRRVVVLGTGGLSEGGREPGVVLSVPWPE